MNNRNLSATPTIAQCVGQWKLRRYKLFFNSKGLVRPQFWSKLKKFHFWLVKNRQSFVPNIFIYRIGQIFVETPAKNMKGWSDKSKIWCSSSIVENGGQGTHFLICQFLKGLTHCASSLSECLENLHWYQWLYDGYNGFPMVSGPENTGKDVFFSNGLWSRDSWSRDSWYQWFSLATIGRNGFSMVSNGS